MKLTDEQYREILQRPAIAKANSGLGAVEREEHAKPAPALERQDYPVKQVVDPTKYFEEIPADSVVCRGKHIGEPMAKERPRFSPQGHAYTPSSTKEHQRALASSIESLSLCLERDTAFGLRVVFYVQTHQRKDVDNLLKTVLDALNKKAFVDDSQVKEVMAWCLLDLKNPRTEFVLYRLGKIDKEQGCCVRCGAFFRRYKSWRERLFCSKKCASLHLGSRVSVKCCGCGRDILRKPSETGDRNYCCCRCKSEATRTPLVCRTCGKKYTRPQSQVKRGSQFCSQGCYWKSMVGSKMPMTHDQLSARSKKAWETRKLKTIMARTDSGEPNTP